MQVLKKLSAFIAVIVLVGCTTAGSSLDNNIKTYDATVTEGTFGEAANFKVGMLLPLTGSASKLGQGLKNAALMALEDVNNPNMMLQFYDTQSTANGARNAVNNAIEQKSQLIIGPLTSEEVKAIADKVEKRNVPVITFSTNTDVLRPGIFSLGLLVNEQVDRVMTYAVYRGRKRFALLVPDNNTGISVARAALISAQKNDVVVTAIAFYPPNTSDFSESLKGITNYDTRAARVKKIRDNLTEKAEKGNETAAKILARLKKIDTLGEVDFDTILIPEHGTRLKSAAAMLGYYDVVSPNVIIIGTSIWENSNLGNESNLIGGWYPALSRNHSSYFINKYSSIFNETPNSIFAFGYDAVALASSLANADRNRLDEAITNYEGFIGINGLFKIFKNGTNHHSLDILEVRKTGDVIVAQASKSIAMRDGYNTKTIHIDEDYQAPKIFGKDKEMALSQIYAEQLPDRHLTVYQDFEELNEEEIVRNALAKHKIVIP